MVGGKGLMPENRRQGFLFLIGWVVIQEAGIYVSMLILFPVQID